MEVQLDSVRTAEAAWTWADILALFKLRIGVAIMLSALAGAVAAGGAWPAYTDLAILAAAVLLAAAGAGACNHWFERDLDRAMIRTASRPFASGRLDPHTGWLVAFGVMILGGGVLAATRFGWVSGAMVVAGAATYAFLYTMVLKRRTHWNIVIGGFAGSFAVLAGAAAVGGLHLPIVWALAAVLFLWTPSHFWSLANALVDDYRRAGIPMLPVTHGPARAAMWNAVNTLLLVISTIVFAILSHSAVIAVGVLAGSGWLAYTTWLMLRQPDRMTSMRAFRASLIQLGTLLIAIFAAFPTP